VGAYIALWQSCIGQHKTISKQLEGLNFTQNSDINRLVLVEIAMCKLALFAGYQTITFLRSLLSSDFIAMTAHSHACDEQE